MTSLYVDLRKWETAIDLRIRRQFEIIFSNLRLGRRFENLKKGHRPEVQMSVTKKPDIVLRIGR